MSRILDYVLEPSVVYTNGSFLVKVKVQDDYKYKKLLVSENMKYTTATGTTYTLTNAVSTNNASILQLQGNTTQTGTPTPTNPIPIYTVSGDNEVVVTGKNLCEGSQDFSGTWVNDSLWITDTETYNGLVVKKRAYQWSGIYKEITVTAGKTYTFSLYAKGDSPRTATIYLSNGTAVLNKYYQAFTTSTEWERHSITFTCTTTGTIRPRLENTTSVSGVYTYICGYQLEENTRYTDYSSLGNSYRVDFGGKNLLKIVKDSTTINGVTFTQNEDGSISVRGTATANASFISTTVQPIEPNRRMKLSGCPSGGSTSTYRLVLRVRSDTTTNIVTVSNTGSGGNDGNVTAYSNAHYILGEIWVYSGQTVDLTFYPQVEYVNLSSDPATEYSPYVSNPIELCKIGNYKDSIFKAEVGNAKYDSLDSTTKASLTLGNWYIEKNIRKVVFTGAGSDGTWTKQTNYYQCSASLGSISSAGALCSHYNYGNINTLNNFTITTNAFRVNDSTDTLTNFKTWLSNNNVTLYYILATPTYEIITNENLIQQLNNLQDMQLIENLCYVDWVGEEKPTMTLQYPTNETLNAYITTEDNKLIRTDWGV